MKKLFEILCVVVLVISLAACGEQTKYKEAKQYYDNGEFQTALNLFEELGNYKDCPALMQSCQYELQTDRSFVREMGKGLAERWNAVKTPGQVQNETEYPDMELAHLLEFKSAVFEDEQLQQLASDYIEALEREKEAVRYYNSDASKYYEMQAAAKSKRYIVISELYYNYGLPIEEKHQDILQQVLDDAIGYREQEEMRQEQEEMRRTIKECLEKNLSIQINVEGLDYGRYEYPLTMSFFNDTPYDLELYFEVHHYDAEGYQTDEWTNFSFEAKSGEKTRQEKHFARINSKTEELLEGTVKIQSVDVTCSEFLGEEMPIEPIECVIPTV